MLRILSNVIGNLDIHALLSIVIISSIMNGDIEYFYYVDGVWTERQNCSHHCHVFLLRVFKPNPIAFLFPHCEISW